VSPLLFTVQSCVETASAAGPSDMLSGGIRQSCCALSMAAGICNLTDYAVFSIL
jgi:hypothetical protein